MRVVFCRGVQEKILPARGVLRLCLLLLITSIDGVVGGGRSWAQTALPKTYADSVHTASSYPVDSLRTDSMALKKEIAPSSQALLGDSLTMLPTPEAPIRRNFLATSSQFTPNSTWAMIYALIPGGGQFYNRKYWKIPIVLAAATACTYAISWNACLYNEYHTAYVDFMNENPLEKDSWKGFVPNGDDPKDYVGDGNIQSRLKKGTDMYRRNRDLSIIVSAAVYLLSIVDAYVDAELFQFDVSPDLSMSLSPSLLAQPWLTPTPAAPTIAPGLSYRLVF